MKFKDYQTTLLKFNVTPEERRLPHALCGLTAEVGELMGKFQKHFRGDAPLTTTDIVKEIGDVLYYLSDLSTTLNLDLEKIAEANVEKLEARLAAKTIKGDGDDR